MKKAKLKVLRWRLGGDHPWMRGRSSDSMSEWSWAIARRRREAGEDRRRRGIEEGLWPWRDPGWTTDELFGGVLLKGSASAAAAFSGTTPWDGALERAWRVLEGSRAECAWDEEARGPTEGLAAWHDAYRDCHPGARDAP